MSQVVIQEQRRYNPNEPNLTISPIIIVGLSMIIFSIIGILIVVYIQQKNKQIMEQERIREEIEKEKLAIERMKLKLSEDSGSSGERKTQIGFNVGTLKVIQGEEIGREYLIFAPKTTIGASKDNDILANTNDKLVSNKHAVIYVYADGTCKLKDLGSTNGTRITRNNTTFQVLEEVLKEGDIILIGSTAMQFNLAKSFVNNTSISQKETYIPMQSSKNTDTLIFTGAKLIVETGDMQGKTFNIVKLQTTLGRQEDRDIVINDQTVSRKHAILNMNGDKFVLINESKVGTKVNGKIIDSIELHNGDTIELGAIKLKFVQA